MTGKSKATTASERYEEYLRTRPKQSRSRGVVEAIFTAAREALTRGEREDRLTLQWVAERAGVGIGSLYDYFGDRASVLAGLTAKITDDNLRELQSELEKTESMSLEEGLHHLVDVIFDKYLPSSTTLSRAILRVAHRTDLMPMLAENQTLFAQALATSLRRRADVRLADPELTAWTLTQMVMGVVHTLTWMSDPPFTREAIAREMVHVAHAALSHEK